MASSEKGQLNSPSDPPVTVDQGIQTDDRFWDLRESYGTRKALAQGLMDVALLTANASQLKVIREVGLTCKTHQFYTLMMVTIISSIALQAIIGVFILILICMNKRNKRQNGFARCLDNTVTFLIFVVAFVNVIISAFGLEDPNTHKKCIEAATITPEKPTVQPTE